MNENRLSKDVLLNEYSKYKKKAIAAFAGNKIESALAFIEYCTSIAWHYPILYNFIDEEIEVLLENISEKILKKNSPDNRLVSEEGKRVVFYNGQIVDYGALTEQYLDFFIENKYSVLFIVPDHKNTKSGQGILQKLGKCENISLFIPDNKSTVGKVQQIYEAVTKFNPSKAFLHFLPNDVMGFCVFSQFDNLTKFYIVHNDHTFWLGKKCSDFFIEFRQFGYKVATKRRGIDSNKILMIPYYPIIQETSFQGFPFDRDGKIVGLSGANLYKYYADPGLSYFHSIKGLLTENPNFVFCLAGWGNTRIIENFIKENDLQERFYFLGKRKDFYKLVGSVDILFESYPFKGGLTVLYATNQSIPVCGIANMRNASQSLETFFDIEVDYKEPEDMHSFIKDANGLIRSEEKRKERAALFSNIPNNKPEFDTRLKQALEGKYQSLKRSYTDILMLDDNYFLDEYLTQPDAYKNLLLIKFFLLKKEMALKERFRLFKKIDTKKETFKRKLRYLFLVAAKR